MKPIRLAVVDDSSFVRRAIGRLLADERRIQVVGTAASGEELLAHLEEWRPDVITLDLAMPGLGGLPTLDRLMAIRPIPVIILSTHSGQGAPRTIEALHRGAVDFIDKQRYSLMDFEALREVLIRKILEVARPAVREPAPAQPSPPPAAAPPSRYRLLAIGASTGGPPAIQRILEDLGPHLPVPLVIVQHMPEGFTRAFASRLASHLPFIVREVSQGEVLRPEAAYIAPAGLHLTLEASGEHLEAHLSEGPVHSLHRPSVDLLFSSVSRVVGAQAVGVLLTGMGSDGAYGMAQLRQAGALTLVQDAETSVVFGMPGAALRLGAAAEVLPLRSIGPRLRRLLDNGE